LNKEKVKIPYCFKDKPTNQAFKETDNDMYLNGFIQIFNLNKQVCMNYIELTKHKYNWNFYNEAIKQYNYCEYNLLEITT